MSVATVLADLKRYFGGAWHVNSDAILTYLATPLSTVADITATPDEINSIADVSARNVTITATGALTAAANGNGKINLLGEVGGDAAVTLTLPAATGSGDTYEFIVTVVDTSNYVIKVTTDDTMKGLLIGLDNDSTAVTGYAASGTDDTLTLNGTTTGGQIGDRVVFKDILADVWSVSGAIVVPAGSNIADCFSATVT